MNNDCINKELFIKNMRSLKEENCRIKELMGSRQYRTGKIYCEISKAFQSVYSLKSIPALIHGRKQWKRLCNLYPIHHNSNDNYEPNYFSNERFVVYTCIIGAYDDLQEPVFLPDNCDFVLITDRDVPVGSSWKKLDARSCIPEYEILSNTERNRFCKMMPHLLFPEYRYSIYIDGNVKPVTDLTEFINCIGREGLCLHMHKARDCVYDEIFACRLLKKASPEALDAFEAFLKKNDFPTHYGMNECNVIARDHKNREVTQMMQEWWVLFRSTDVKRDQLSFPYILYRHGIKPNKIGTLGANVQENPAIRVVQHDIN